MTLSATYLFIPADRPDRFDTMLGSDADQVILDREDAVRPAAKAVARRGILEASLDWSRVVVRINVAASPLFAGDLRCLADLKAAVMVPKAETPQALSRLAGALSPVESVTPDVKDNTLLRADTQAARNLGSEGKLPIHPAQVAPVAEVFRPSDAECNWARRVLAAAGASPSGAVAVDGKMDDKPVEEAARRILARAGQPHA